MANPRQTVHFGIFEFDTDDYELRRDGKRVKLQEQPLRLLRMLVLTPDRVITREEIRKELWPPDIHIDFDHSLRIVVNKVRHALGDTADSPRFIQTLPGRGYKFIAPTSGKIPSDHRSRAYELYLRGRYHWSSTSEQGYGLVLRYYSLALEEDPELALAYAGLADAYNVFAMYTSGLNSVMPITRAAELAEESARKAIALDESLAEAHSALGIALLQFKWDARGAEQEHRTAIELNPRSAQARHWYGWYLAQMGRFRECYETMEKARTLDPLSLVVNAHFGWYLYLGREFTKSHDQLVYTRQLNSNFPLTLLSLGTTQARLGIFKEAIEILEACAHASEFHTGVFATLAHVYGLAGRITDARAIVDKMTFMSSQRIVMPYFMAYALAEIDEDASVIFLEQAFKEKSGWMPHLQVEPAFDKLRSKPRFQELSDRVRSLVGN